MKKITVLSIITSIVFFSCASTKSSNEELLDDQTAAIETVEQTNDEYSEIQVLSENNSDDIQTSEELPVEEVSIPLFIPEEEKVSEQEILDDLALLTEPSEESDKEEIISQTQDALIENNSDQILTSTIQESPEKSHSTITEEISQKDSVAEESSASTLTVQEEAQQAAETINNSQKEAPVIPSRAMEVKNNQYIDITYPGTGWVYLGEVERENHFIFCGRKINEDSTTFTLQSRKSGSAILHFYKNDNLSKKYIDDYIEISINTESATDNTHLKCPDYAKIIPPKPQKPQTSIESEEEKPVSENNITKLNPVQESVSENKSADPELNIQTIIQNSKSQEQNSENEALPYPASSVDNISASENITDINNFDGDLLEAALKAYNEKKYPEALALVKKYLLDASTKIDEAIFLEGRILEAASPVQNIKDAISDYETIVKSWPQSKLWKKANERSIYLKRFYIDIR